MIDADAVGLAHHAREWPDKAALILGERSISFAQLDARELFPPGSVIEFYGASEGGFTRLTLT